MRDLKIKALLFKSLFGIGIFLFIVNIYGSFISLRNDAIYYLNLTDKVTMSPEQFYDSLDYYAKSNLPDTFKLVRMNRLVYKTMLHYWGDELADELNLRIPFYRNYILFTLSYVLPEGYYKDNMRKFEFREYTQAIERGVGLCSQHAIVFTEVARVNGYNVRLLRLNGHVVASVEVDTTKDKRWIFDPDFGVTIRHSLKEVQKNPELIRKYYKRRGYSDAMIDSTLIPIYSDPNYRITEGGIRNEPFYWVERFIYFLKWAIPLLLMFPFAMYLYRNYKK